MPSPRFLKAKPALFSAAALLCALLLAGCDEYVRIIRDRDVHISKHATWAWQPMAERPERRASRDTRPVISRDVIGRGDSARGETITRENDPENDILRGKVKLAIEQSLMAKGMKQVVEPEDADFLVDFHLAVRRRNVTVGYAYPGGYPGLACGPFGCYEGWGWGPAGVSYENIRFREGTIVFDFIQHSTNHLAYRAIGEKPVNRDSFSFTQDEVNGLIHHLLKDLKTGK
jgi:hypothetical protein